jgi:hypothetical protein
MAMPLDLIDKDDGENRAVRWFLACYGGASGVTVGAMKRHLTNCGYPFWPTWVAEQDREHLTKGGAQHWLRHLFALETGGVALPGPTLSMHPADKLEMDRSFNEVADGVNVPPKSQYIPNNNPGFYEPLAPGVKGPDHG